ncbi:hypothetical protein OG705_30310 [Streptomyces sp. NBC_00838]|uniref:hypothetical protein n=1 Tax=Streptomyces sp. NBC_00838 TaxID=2903680 RepID=UPI003868D490|nr:hypothetical protein OG705_30310 [Streptomyces sp. NBC_00838]
MLPLQDGMLHRSVEVTNLLFKRMRVHTDGVWLWTAKNETRKKGKARWRSIREAPT